MQVTDTIRSLLEYKGHDVWSVGPGASVYDAIELMSERDIGALPVMQDGKLVGLLSERDYARKIILKGRASRDTRVEEIMTPNVIVVTPRTKARECMALMTERNIRHLPVVDEGRVLGMISIRDIVGDIIADQDFTIEQLEHYISGQ